MELLETFEELDKVKAPRVITIGNFDGIHIGHQKLINKTILDAKKLNLPSFIVSFFPHPRKVFARNAIKLINTIEQKTEVFSQMDIDYLYILKFQSELYELSGRDFIEKILFPKLKPKKINIGYDFRFGKGGDGDYHLLTQLGDKLGFYVEELSPVMLDGEIVSSSAIRKYIINGDVKKAARLLGKRYFMEGKIVKGEGRGKTIGIPTTNLASINELVPLCGVYATFLEHDNNFYPSITNIGYKPTFNNEADEKTIETYIFYFDGNLYGENIKLHFADRIRSEKKFNSVEELIKQISQDIEEAKRIINNEPDNNR